MIIEINRSAQMNGLGYNIKKLCQSKAEIIATKWIPKDASGEEIAKIFQASTQHCRVEKKYAHLSISPALEDWENGLTVEQLADIGRYAMDRLFPGVPYIIFIHRDIDRWHAHAVCPTIRRDGTHVSDRFEYRRAMKLSREIETLWALEKALEKSEERRINRASPIEYGSGSLAQKIGDVLALAKTYNFTRLGELNAFLSLYNCNVEQVDNDKKRGLSYFILQDGRRVGRAIVATKIHGGALASIEKKINDSKHANHDYNKIRIKIENAITNAINFEDFKANLERMNVRTVKRFGREGNILGVTFVDDEDRVIVNGSFIGREYSYLNIMKRFEQTDYLVNSKAFKTDIGRETENEIVGAVVFTAPSLNEFPSIPICGGGDENLNKKRKKRKIYR